MAEGGNIFTNKYGPFAGWQWAALIAGGGALFLWWRKGQAANQASSATDLTGTATGFGPLPGATQLEPIIIQQGAPSTPSGKPGEGGLAGFSFLTNPSKISGPQRVFTPTSGKTLADLLVKNGLLTKTVGGGYKTTKKFGGTPRKFDPNVSTDTLTAVLLKEGIIVPVAPKASASA